MLFGSATLSGIVLAHDDYSHHVTLDVRARIDGRSQLVIQGNRVYWHHLDFAAPGRLDYTNTPTHLNNLVWFPRWPDIPSTENRDCNCFSSTIRGIPTLPAIQQMVTLKAVRVRGEVAIVQQPNQSNGYTLIVEFNDNPQSGASWYFVDLKYKTTPKTRHQCDDGGWRDYVRADGTRFHNERECKRYAG